MVTALGLCGKWPLRSQPIGSRDFAWPFASTTVKWAFSWKWSLQGKLDEQGSLRCATSANNSSRRTVKHHVHHDVKTLVEDTWQKPTRGCHAASMHTNFPSSPLPSQRNKLACFFTHCTYWCRGRRPSSTKIWKLRQASTDPSAGSIHHKTPSQHTSTLDCSSYLPKILLHRERSCSCVCGIRTVRDFQGWCAASVRSSGFLFDMFYALKEVCVFVVWLLCDGWCDGLDRRSGRSLQFPYGFACVCVYGCMQLWRCVLVERVYFKCLWGCGIFEFDKMPGLALGDLVPDVEADSTMGHIKVRDYCKDGWTIIFSHPGKYRLFLLCSFLGCWFERTLYHWMINFFLIICMSSCCCIGIELGGMVDTHVSLHGRIRISSLRLLNFFGRRLRGCLVCRDLELWNL